MVQALTDSSSPRSHSFATTWRCRCRSTPKVPLLDVAMFCRACKTLNLDPLVRQAHWITRKGRGALQLGIDGFRAIADRAGNYAGSSEPVFRGTLEHGKQVVPEYCQVTVWKIVQGQKSAFTGEARWTEFVPDEKADFMWRKMPRHMLAKCAEAQALRKGWALQSIDFTPEEEAPAADVQIIDARPTLTWPTTTASSPTTRRLARSLGRA